MATAPRTPRTFSSPLRPSPPSHNTSSSSSSTQKKRPGLGVVGCGALLLLLAGLGLFLSAATLEGPNEGIGRRGMVIGRRGLGIVGTRISSLSTAVRARLREWGPHKLIKSIDGEATSLLGQSISSASASASAANVIMTNPHEEAEELAETLLASLLLLVRSVSETLDNDDNVDDVITSKLAIFKVTQNVLKFIETTTTTTTGGNGSSNGVHGVRHDIASLYTLVVCRSWDNLNIDERIQITPIFQATTLDVWTRARQGDTSVLSLPESGGESSIRSGHIPLKYSVLRSAQAIAALHCLGSSSKSFATVNIPSGNAALAVAELLRRGLRNFFLTTAESSSDGFGPYDEGSVPSTRYNNNNNKTLRVRGATSDTPLLLFFLDSEDIPISVAGELALAGARLATPAGVSSGRGVTSFNLIFDSIPALGAPPPLHVWRVSPIEQPLILAGALKHLLPAITLARAGSSGGSGGDSGEWDNEETIAWGAADALVLLIDTTLRIAAPLVSFEREASERSLIGPNESNYHRLTFPRAIVPLLHNEIATFPHNNNDNNNTMIPGWIKTLTSVKGNQMIGGAEGGPAPPPNAALSTSEGRRNHNNTITAADVSTSTRYPIRGLAVITINSVEHTVIRVAPLPAAGGELSGLEKSNANAGSVYQAAHAQAHVKGEIADEDPNAVIGTHGVGAAISVRGDGPTLFPPTAVAARIFRHLYQQATQWLAISEAARTQAAANAANAATSSKKKHHDINAAEAAEVIKAAALWPARALRAARARGFFSAAARAPLSARPMLSFLTSGAADVTALVTSIEWAPTGTRRVLRETALYAVNVAAERWIGSSGSDNSGSNGNNGNSGNSGVGNGLVGLAALRAQKREASEQNRDSVTTSHNRGDSKSASTSKSGIETYVRDNKNENLTAEAMGHLRVGKKDVEHLSGEAVTESENDALAERVKIPDTFDTKTTLPIATPIRSVPILIDVLLLYERLCANDSSSIDAPWANSCCASGALSSLIRGDDPGNGFDNNAMMVPISAIPTFLCSESSDAAAMPGKGGILSKRSIRLSCASVRDDYCDCTADGADEDKTAACSAVGPSVKFLCSKGVRNLIGGSSGSESIGGDDGDENSNRFISASKVGDGIEDCIDGEDEK